VNPVEIRKFLREATAFGRLPAGLPVTHPAAWLATWFGAGLLPLAPGSWGSLAALPFGWAMMQFGGVELLGLGVLVATFAGIWAADIFVQRAGREDAQAIVIDEVAGQWMVLLVTPLDWPSYALAFLLFRATDTIKPWPANVADRALKGGVGAMLDDLIAAVYATGAMALIVTLAQNF